MGAGLYKFVVTKPEVVTDTLKLKTNRVLNTCGAIIFLEGAPGFGTSSQSVDRAMGGVLAGQRDGVSLGGGAGAGQVGAFEKRAGCCSGPCCAAPVWQWRRAGIDLDDGLRALGYAYRCFTQLVRLGSKASVRSAQASKPAHGAACLPAPPASRVSPIPPSATATATAITTGSFARPWSNSCGILGLFFSGAESLYVYQLEPYGVPDNACTLLAGERR